MDEVDYLVVGAGASSLAFLDVMLAETDATFAVVDKRPEPGGHWNDAYPYVRLHQPSLTYGVTSLELGSRRIAATGFNAGLLESASGHQIAGYFHTLMDEVLLPSGRVRYLPMTEHVGHGECRGLLSGVRLEIEHSTLVDATLVDTSIPLTHERSFSVAEGVTCIPPNELPRRAPGFDRFTVLGGGKTAYDAVLFLLRNGTDPARIRWVVPRDAWMVNRAVGQCGADFYGSIVRLLADQHEACAAATDTDDLFHRLEACRFFRRLDESVWPTMCHAATISDGELSACRQVRDVVRNARVRAILGDSLELTDGSLDVEPRTLHIDCTATALGKLRHAQPVFTEGRIAIQWVRQFQPTFSGAMIGLLEATIDDPEEKQRLAQPSAMTDTPEDWVLGVVPAMENERNWLRHPRIREWLARCRLNAFGNTLLQEPPDDIAVADRARLATSSKPALENLRRLAVTIRADGPGSAEKITEPS